MYQVEEQQHQELFTIKVRDGEIVTTTSVWAYDIHEAHQKVEDEGYEVLD